MPNGHLIAFGANPAWQKTLFFDHFRPGQVNRARDIRAFASGKGINFCRAARCDGRFPARLLQFAGGENGAHIERDLAAEALTHRTVRTRNPTRCCITCLCKESGSMTELIEPSYPTTLAEMRQILDALDAELPGARFAALCGTLPTGTPPSLYVEVAKRVHAAGIPLLVDCFRDIEPVLELGGDMYLKINVEELLLLTGATSTPQALRALFGHYKLAAVAITDGPGQAYLAFEGRLFRYMIPRLKEVINPLGSGDTASAILAAGILSGVALPEAFRRALGAASANCLSELCGHFDPAEAIRLAGEIRPEEIGF